MGSVKKIGSDICNDFISFEENILRLSAKLYRQSLVSAFPARYETNRNKFAIPNERNASFFFAHAFAKANEGGGICMEMKGSTTGKKSVDVVLNSKEYLLCVETKKYVSGNTADAIYKDIEKLDAYSLFEDSYSSCPKYRRNCLLIQTIDWNENNHKKTIKSEELFSKSKLSLGIFDLSVSKLSLEKGIRRLGVEIRKNRYQIHKPVDLIDPSLSTYETFSEKLTSKLILISWSHKPKE